MHKPSNNLQFISLEQAFRCAILLFAADIPFILWGSVGVGKSSIIKQLAARLKWKLFDVRGSDKSPEDLAGIPYPDGEKVRYLMPSIIPWQSVVGDEKCILFLDEIDRSEKPVMNVEIQLFLDRCVNSNKLGKNVRICGAGNGSTDSGTTEITDALATRAVHLYIESTSDSALDAYDKWAEENGISPMLRAYAKTRTDVWAGNGIDKLIEHARPTKRGHDAVDKILQLAPAMRFKTSDILRPLVCGAVGFEAGISVLAFNELWTKCPPIEDILSAPETTPVPEDAGIIYALSVTLTDKSGGDTEEQRKRAEQVAKYLLRFPAEQQAYAFNRLEKIQPWIVTRKVWTQRAK